MKRSLFFVVVMMFLAACAGYARSAVRVASLDHACDKERISILEHDGTTIVLDVCGRRRVYRDTAGANNPATWTDVTLTTEDCGGGRTSRVDAAVATEEEAPVTPTPIEADAGAGSAVSTDAGDAASPTGDADAASDMDDRGMDAAVGDAAVDADAGVGDAGVLDAGTTRPRGRRTR